MFALLFDVINLRSRMKRSLHRQTRRTRARKYRTSRIGKQSFQLSKSHQIVFFYTQITLQSALVAILSVSRDVAPGIMGIFLRNQCTLAARVKQVDAEWE